MSRSVVVRTAAVIIALMATPLPMRGLAATRSQVPDALVLDRPGEPPISPFIARFVADHPEAHVIRAIAADVNRDGDLDVLASTADAPFVVWINDGTGHFTRHTAAAATSLSARPGSRVHPHQRAQPGVVTGSNWRDALAGGARLDVTSTTRTAVHPTTAPLPTFARFISGPSRAPPTTHTA